MLATLPAWGMTRGGVLFEQPTPVRLTEGRGCSSSLPTPTASMATGAGTEGREGGPNLQTAVALLPTPTASDWQHRQKSDNWQGHDLVSTIGELTSDPTPPPSDGGNEC